LNPKQLRYPSLEHAEPHPRSARPSPLSSGEGLLFIGRLCALRGVVRPGDVESVRGAYGEQRVPLSVDGEGLGVRSGGLGDRAPTRSLLICPFADLLPEGASYAYSPSFIPPTTCRWACSWLCI